MDTMTIDYWKQILSGYSPISAKYIVPQPPDLQDKSASANDLLNKQRGTTVLAIGAPPVCGLKTSGVPHFLS
ncbi:hypothetical protein GQ600_18850 [Phytophthora cactorum]|nr:hypothetical protein GQ600_18850 [Phytophthora cactorum]